MFNRALSIVVLSLVAFALGCEKSPSGATSSTQPGASASAEGKKITICLLPKQKNIPYFITCKDGAEQAAKDLGNVELIYDGPTDASAEKAAGMIEKWTQQGVDVIAVSPNDPDVLAPAMKKARDKGIHVITWDSDGKEGTREFFVNQATAKDIGAALVDALAKDIAGTADPKTAAGEVAIVTASLTASNQNEWMKYMNERLPTYPGLKLVATKPSNEDPKLAFQVAQDVMKAYPDLKGMWAISSSSFPACADAIKQAGKSGKVPVTGLATPNDMKALVMDGTVKSVVLWNTNDLGYLTVKVARALCDGKLKAGDATFDAGKLGAKKVVGDNVLLGDILVFNKENIGKYDF